MSQIIFRITIILFNFSKFCERRTTRRLRLRCLPTSDFMKSSESINSDTTDTNFDENHNVGENTNEPEYVDGAQPNENTIQIHLRNRVIMGKYNTVKLIEVAIVADRYAMTDTEAAPLATATLIDFKIIKPEQRQFVIDRMKIHRCRKRARDKQLSNLDFNDIQGLYFDGRADSTISYDNEKRKISTKKEEHMKG